MSTATVLPMNRRRRVVDDALERRFQRLVAMMAARTITLREAVDEVHDVYIRRTALQARTRVADQPAPVADAYVASQVTRAFLEVELDRQACVIDLAVAERGLGQVIVLPCGRRLGPPPPAQREPITGSSLW